MLATVNVRKFLPPWLILTVPKGLGVTQVTAHIQQSALACPHQPRLLKNRPTQS